MARGKCQCGCGYQLKNPRRRFVSGHNQYGSFFDGKKRNHEKQEAWRGRENKVPTIIYKD